MRFKIGRLSFPSKEHFDNLVNKGIIAEYDTSPHLREKHAREVGEKYNTTGGLSSKKRATFWLSYLKEKVKPRPLREDEEVVNPWM